MTVDSVTRWAANGMVATVDHLATGAGVRLLAGGGSAVDAAIAANAVLTVTAPHLCGMGGDLVALVHHENGEPPAALLAVGRAGRGADPDRLVREGHRVMPFTGDLRSVTVPGCVDGWLALHERFGRAPLDAVLAPAIRLAEGGFPASPLLAAMAPLVGGIEGADDLARTPDGGRVGTGSRLRRAGVGAALRAIAGHGRDGFYGGPFGAGLLAMGAGLFDPSDLSASAAQWTAPIALDVWGHRVWTVPPPSQGYLVLLGAAIAARQHLPDDPRDPAWAHLLAEAARAAAHDRPALLHDGMDPTAVLAAPSVGRRAGLVDAERRSSLAAPSRSGDTTYLATVDADGLAVSLIQSNASGFGALVFEPATGIGLHNRGIGFSLEPGHPARLAPGRRPPHTLAPALVTTPTGDLRALVGSMGGDAQPQIVLQLLGRLLRGGERAGRAVAAPRWALTAEGASGFDTWRDPGATVTAIEPEAADSWRAGLEARGHQVLIADGVTGMFGHAQVVERTAVGTLAGAADPRALIADASGL